MEEIIGKEVTIEGRSYTVTDVRKINGDTLVYAESNDHAGGAPARAAFHYTAVEAYLANSAVTFA